MARRPWRTPLLSLVGAAALASACTTAPMERSGPDAAEPEGELEPTTIVVSTGAEPSAACGEDTWFPAARTDVGVDGNRLSDASIDLAAAEAVDVSLPATAEWVVPNPGDPGAWYVALDDGTAVHVDPEGGVSAAGDTPEGAPELDVDGVVHSSTAHHRLFEDVLPDSRVVRAGNVAVALGGATDRYPHGVLGDSFEASAILIRDLCAGERRRIDIPAPDVIEGISPLLADVDGDGAVEILVTLSNAEVGARLSMFRLDGTLLAESAPIGRGNRWRNQLAVGPFGPDGQTEVIDVRTPHIGGTVQAFRLSGTALERVAASGDRYTTHVIGSRNLDMGLAVDGNADGRPDVVVATSDRRTLVGLTRTAEDQGWSIIADLVLDGVLTSNVAVQSAAGQAQLAAGVGERLWVLRGPA